MSSAHDSLKGQLLVSSPKLLDPNFEKTVVLMIHHDDEGAFGLVLNRPMMTTIREVWAQVSESFCLREDALHRGGPVEGPLMAIHNNEEYSEMEILPGVYFSAGADELSGLVAAPEHDTKFFVGHSGWGPGQLESELEEGAWLTTSAESLHVFRDGEEFWSDVMDEIAGTTIPPALKVKHVPKDPSMN
ncbi:hypothetical protein Pan216_44380 [Planctomycetes bacterium Pan216]|uniref:Uncharacterized protein n=1 Tax=Kolteria novifilia TaxID=2527975 RepID=A0A518B997_9BACT|nr:hypothetical protein Pan216_44380 [Planctomycetes bacterium Pan216]